MHRGIVFDLDDTLFLERGYVESGFRALAKDIEGSCGLPEGDIFSFLWQGFLAGVRGDSFDRLREAFPFLQAGVTVAALVRLYRLHEPRISLAPGAGAMLAGLRNAKMRIGIVTDGPPSSQSRKVRALGLWPLVDDVVFTGYWGNAGAKPSPRAFVELGETWGLAPACLTYVGDNPAKDFVAPNYLGWRTIRLRCSGQLRWEQEAHDAAHAPHVEVSTMEECSAMIAAGAGMAV